MKEIGGYFEIDLLKGESYHKEAIELNTARNCFEYVLLSGNVKKVFIPHYTCEVMLEPIKRHSIDYEYYYLDQNLDPIIPETIKVEDSILYTNYFGIKQNTVLRLSESFQNLIVDNSMGFYSPRVKTVDTFYSARKFFGVPDGAYLYTNKILNVPIEKDYSHERITHLFKRIEMGAHKAYKEFLANDYKLYDQPIRYMSDTTRAILKGIDYEKGKIIREMNFLYMHEHLEKLNELKIETNNNLGPMFYPLLINSQGLKEKLIEKNIYLPTLWRNAAQTAKKNSFEHHLTNNLLALPIDQRYGLSDMKYILDMIVI